MRRVLALAALLATAWAQEEPVAENPDPEPTPPVASGTIEFRHEVELRSGTLLVGTIEPAAWRVSTAFGSLTVPIEELKSVRFGRKADPDRLAGVRRLLKDLSSANPDRRAHARVALKDEGAFAVADLAVAAKDHEDPEVRRICTDLLEELAIPEKAIVPDEDRIETSKFALTGTVDPASFKVTVAELGALNVRRCDIVMIRLFKATRTQEAKISGANTFVSGWVDTGIKYSKGDAVRITAEGNIHFPNWGGQVFTPDGNFQMGQISNIPVGALTGRIGDNGALFRVGTSYSGTAANDGTLQLCVMLNVRGQPSSGEYTARIARAD